jgi:hypothetical protein
MSDNSQLEDNSRIEDNYTCGQYNKHTYTYVRIVYIILLIIWIVTIWYFKLYIVSTWYILLIPVGIFIYAIATASLFTYDTEGEMSRISYLSLGILLAIPLLTWMNKEFEGDKEHFLSIIFVALGFSVLTYIDFWVTKRWLSVFKHARGGLQSMSVTLFLFAITTYFSRHSKSI